MLLAADIAESTLLPSWDAIGHLTAVAAIRTLLNYFLERDMREVREIEDEIETPDPIARPLGAAARRRRG